MQTALATLHTHVGHWLLHRLSPWGGDSIDSDEFLGTSDSPMTQSDVMAAKYCFPSDLRVDFVHRNMLRGRFSQPSGAGGPATTGRGAGGRGAAGCVSAAAGAGSAAPQQQGQERLCF